MRAFLLAFLATTSVAFAVTVTGPFLVDSSCPLYAPDKAPPGIYRQVIDIGEVVIDDPVPITQGIVYSRIKRNTTPHMIKYAGKDHLLKHPDRWDLLPETAAIVTDITSPGQLVFRDTDGRENVIFDCNNCVPIDPAVSLDGKKIAFSAIFGETYPYLYGIQNKPLTNTYAQMHIYDLETGKIRPWKRVDGQHDFGPAWLPDGRIMFTSNRYKINPPWVTPVGKKNSRMIKPMLWIADENGANAVNVSPHEVAGALHPYLLSSGRVVYSSHWLSRNLPHTRNANSPNNHAAIDNEWVIAQTDWLGGDNTIVFGGSKNFYYGSNPNKPFELRAMHFIGERDNGDVCATNYYRRNNFGLGDVICWAPEENGIEGPAPEFMPEITYKLAEWGSSGDNHVSIVDGEFIGKIGYPEGTGDGSMIVTYGKGMCSRVPINPITGDKMIEAMPPGSRIGCDTGIYRTTVIPSESPKDLEVIVNRPEWHEFNARVVRARTIDDLEMRATTDNTCQIVNSNADRTDGHHYGPYRFNKMFKAAANNGTEIYGLPHSDMVAVRFYEVLQNPHEDNPGTKFHPVDKMALGDHGNVTGNQLKLLGDVPLLADGSFRVELPCETPYVIAGVDKDGYVIKHDQYPRSLRQGEERVCKGCHLHGEMGRDVAGTLAETAAPVKLLTSTRIPTWDDDVQPIVEAKCMSCHENDAFLASYDSLVKDYLQLHVRYGTRVEVGKPTDPHYRRYGLNRPLTSKYISSLFARESLLYWKAANERLDGRTDDTYPDDIDFGADHPTDLTPAELRTIARWIDAGSQEKYTF